jgi:two-component system, OmpR family, sensor histidine kinase KdpD
VGYERRKTPEEFLRDCQAEEGQASKGYLKIFLGYASGVGKSFRMLDEARRRRDRGQDVVVAAVQPQVPVEVGAVLKKLEIIPLQQVDQGTAVDVEKVLVRHPAVCFIDGLAYDNPPGSRNATRWQDAKELVHAGIKVIASVNIQYVAELQEQVEAITGKHVTQMVPIAFIKSADEIEIVDAPAIEPMERTPGEQASAQVRQQQLLRLREMALVLAADVVDQQLNTYLECQGIKQRFGTVERILMCFSPEVNAEQMIATARMIAQKFYGEAIAVYVNQPQLSSSQREALDQKLALARAAGAKVEILKGPEPVDTILEYARTQGITQLFIGHSHRSNLWSQISGNRIDRFVRQSRGMDVRIFPKNP